MIHENPTNLEKMVKNDIKEKILLQKTLFSISFEFFY